MQKTTKRRKGRRIQRPIVDGRGRRIPRAPMTACLMREIEAAITHTAQRFNTSKSLVMVTALAEFFGIMVDRFDES